MQQEIIQAGVVRRIVRRISNGETEPYTIGILLELSKTETFVETIGNTKDCIPLMVSLFSNPNPDISLKAQNVLQNLSSNTHFAVKTAEAGYFQPFVARFNQGKAITPIGENIDSMISNKFTYLKACSCSCRKPRDSSVDGCSIGKHATQRKQYK